MNIEYQSMLNRSTCIMESLFNLGIYFMENGPFTVAGVQSHLGKNVSEDEFVLALYAMDVLKRISPRREKSERHDEYVKALQERIKFRRHHWLGNLLTKLFTRNSSKLIARSLKKLRS